jgi:dipeptidyl-peptidase-4
MALSKRLSIPAAALAVLVSAAWLSAQAQDTSALRSQIDRIFKDRAYDPPRFGPARWLPDGTAYAIVERNDTRSEIARYEASTGARRVLASIALDIDDYEWSPDGTRLLIFTNTRKVWRDNTRGDYWVVDVGSGSQKKIGGSAPEASLMFAKFSPDGTRVGYVRANNIYVETIATGATTQLTRDGSETTINGTSDWVYEEELGVRDAFRWSPDGRQIAYWQFDSTGVGVFSLINDTATLYPVVTKIPYPKAGTSNSAVRVGVVAAGGGDTRWMKVEGDPRDNYIASLEWVDASTIAMQHLNRLQNRNDFLFADAKTGAVTPIFRDESNTWVDVQDGIVWIDKGAAFLWISERDGWRHIYRVSKRGGQGQLLTKFDADVTDFVGADSTSVYFLASPSNATERYLYRAPLDGSAAPARVTPADQRGWHTYELAPGGRVAFHTWSAFDRPPVMDVIDVPSHRSLRALTDPSALVATLAPVVKPPVEFLTVDVGGGVTLDGWMLKPPTFDPSRKYPVIVHVYGEPASQTVTNRWGSRTMLFHRALAEAGYIVVSFDNRGTPAPKGAAWRKVIYGTVGDLSSKDQAVAIRALASRYSFVDLSRIGVWGWSGGGSNTLNCMFRFPDVYKVGVSVAPVPDQTLYDTIYQERYMGLPQKNAEGYRLGSPINFAAGLKGSLLVVHGSGDDNVHYQGTERLVNRLVELGKPFDLMVYPNRTHAISEGPGTTPHIYQLIARYFVDHLPAGAR